MNGPYPPPLCSYLICCNPRTGSWLLAEALENTGIAGRPKEYFAPEQEATWTAAWGLPADHPYDAYLASARVAGTTPNGVFGAKVHWYQFETLALGAIGRRHEPRHPRFPFDSIDPFTLPEVARKLDEALPVLTYVWLSRHDRARQAVSYYKATKSGTWWEVTGNPQPGSPVEYDFTAINRLAQRIASHEAFWQRYFEICHIIPLLVAYEDLVANYEWTVRNLLRSLRIEMPPTLEIVRPRLLRQADQETEEWVARYLADLEAVP